MQAKEHDVFFARVWSAIEKGGNNLLWTSESDYPLKAIKLSKVDLLHIRMSGTKWVKDKDPQHRFRTMKEVMPLKRWAKGWERLMTLFVEDPTVQVYKEPVQSPMEEDLGKTPTEFRLYVLKDMGFYKVGFFTTLIET